MDGLRSKDDLTLPPFSCLHVWPKFLTIRDGRETRLEGAGSVMVSGARVSEREKSDAARYVSDLEDLPSKPDEIAIVRKPPRMNGVETLLICGLADTPPDARGIRRLGQKLGSRLKKARARLAHIVLNDFWPGQIPVPVKARLLAQGMSQGWYEFTRYQPAEPGTVPVTREEALRPRIQFLTSEIEPGLLLQSEAVNWAATHSRDLANTPRRDIGPSELALEAVRLHSSVSQLPGLEVRALYPEEFQDCRLLLAVNAGCSSRYPFVAGTSGQRDDFPARLIIMTWTPREYPGTDNGGHEVTFVCKGVTFNAGGGQHKPDGGKGMHVDKSAATMGLTIPWLAHCLGIKKTRITVIIGATDNATAHPHYMKPGDIIKSRAGHNVRITHTDAEGRLILADLLNMVESGYAIALTTVSGSTIEAFGHETFAPVMGNDAGLLGLLVNAGEAAGEPLHCFDILPEDRDAVKDEKGPAQLVNYGGKLRDIFKAGAFLESFARSGVRWAYIDAAGTLIGEDDKATGWGPALVAEFLLRLE